MKGVEFLLQSERGKYLSIANGKYEKIRGKSGRRDLLLGQYACDLFNPAFSGDTKALDIYRMVLQQSRKSHDMCVTLKTIKRPVFFLSEGGNGVIKRAPHT